MDRLALLEHLFRTAPEDSPVLQLLDCYPSGIIAIYRRRIIFANRFFCQLTGYELHELLGQSTRIFYLNPDEWEEFGRKLYGEFERGSSKVILIWDFKKKDGSVFKGRIVAVPVRKIEGHWLLICAIDDVTWEEDYLSQLEERVPVHFSDASWQSERLEKQKSFLIRLIEHLPVGVLIFSRKQVFYRNRIFDHYFPESIPDFVWEFLEGFERDPGQKVKQVTLEDGRILLLQAAALTDGYRLLVLQDVTFFVRVKENFDGYVEARLEERLAQERLILMGKILAEIIHEINTPVSFMKTNLQVFRAYLESLSRFLRQAPLSGEDRRKVESLLGESESIASSLEMGVERIAQLVQSVRTLSHQRIERQDVSLREALEEALSLTHNRAKKVLTIRVNGQPYRLGRLRLAEDAVVRASKASVVQMFVIVVNNVVEAARERRVRHAALEITVRRTERGVEVRFADNCGGVDEEELGRLFDQFYTTKAEGSGLGLYILRQLARALNVEVQARNSEESGGLEMVFVFPDREAVGAMDYQGAAAPSLGPSLNG